MKNIIVCSAIFDSSATGAYHFPHHLLALNTLQTRYRFWIFSEDVDENRAQRNKNSETHIRKVVFKRRPWLFPVLHFQRNWAYYRAIRQLRRAQSVDFVLFNQAFYGVLARLILPRRIKMAGIVHDAFSLQSNRSSYFSEKSFLFYQLTQRPLETLANYLQDFTIANSQFTHQLILKKRRLPPERVAMIYQSLDMGAIDFHPSNWLYTEGGVLKILFVKSDFVCGGLQDLIQALSLLPFLCQLTVIGPEHRFAALIATWTQPHGNIILNFIGLTNKQVVEQTMKTHHILCIPARQEGLGLANVEGLACGISVVSTRVGGIPEVLDFGECGWLAEAENPTSLAEALQNCIESTLSVRRAKSVRGRAHVERLFDKTRMQEHLLRFFDTIL